MPAVGFFCPSFFRPTIAAPSDPAVLEVARAIYGGRADGAQGMDCVAHLIQNRMNNSAFPSDALAVITSGAEQFPQAPRQATPSSLGPADKQQFDRAKSMAAQLIYPPYRLSFPDPTGGKLQSGSNGATSIGNSSNARAGHVAEAPIDPGRDEFSDDGGQSPPPASPRPVLPTRSRRPLAFLMEQSVAGINIVRRPYVDGGGESSPTSGGSPATATSSTPSAASASSRSSPGSNLSNSRTPPPNTGAVPATHAGDQPVRPSTPPTPQLSSTANTGATSTANSPLATPSSRLINRPGRGPRSATSPRPGRLGPTDTDGYHDMILPCGLFQDDVIEFMYRDLSPEDFEKLSKLDERLPKRNTAQKNLVDRLPRVPVKDLGVTECSVCLGNFESSAVQLPCSHAFHHACISKWLTQCKNTCPLCSAPITAESSSTEKSAAASTSAPSRTSSSMRTL